MRRWVHGIRDTFRRLGAWNGSLCLASRALEAATRRRCRLLKYYFFAQPIPDGALAPVRPNERVRIDRIDAGDPMVARFPRPPAVIARRFAEGAVCFVARRDDEFVGFLWLQQDAYQEDEVRCRFVLAPHGRAAWDFDVHVEPAFRMGRAFARLWEAANAHLRERGVEWSLSRISAFNPDSVRAHARLRSRRIGGGVFLCAGPLQVSLLDCAPYAHVSLRDASFPVLRLDAASGAA